MEETLSWELVVIDDRHLIDFAQRLVPEAFSRRTTAHLVEIVDEHDRAPGFDAWTHRMLQTMIDERYPAGHRPVGIIVIEGGDGIRWRWDTEPCSQTRWFVDRVRREADQIPEPWVFAIDLPFPEPVWEATDPVTGCTRQLSPPEWRDTRWRATWYAEARGRGAAAVRAGAVELDYDPDQDLDRTLRRVALPPREGLRKAYHRILYGHPARKQHPLR